MRALSAKRLIVKLLRNVLGGLLVLAGIIMLFTPGQGILTIIIGVAIMDFPGKQRLVTWLNQFKWVRKARELYEKWRRRKEAKVEGQDNPAGR